MRSQGIIDYATFNAFSGKEIGSGKDFPCS
jgi:hypothetical protein